MNFFLKFLACFCCVLIVYLLDKIIEAENMKYYIKKLNKIVENRVNSSRRSIRSSKDSSKDNSNENELLNAPYITTKDLKEQMTDLYLINFTGFICLLLKGLALFMTINLVM